MIQTLEQLKALSQLKRHALWADGEFPFDKARCGVCMTNHHPYLLMHYRWCKEDHQDFISEVGRHDWSRLHRQEDEVIEVLWAMRKLFADYYEIPFPDEPNEISNRELPIGEPLEAANQKEVARP